MNLIFLALLPVLASAQFTGDQAALIFELKPKNTAVCLDREDEITLCVDGDLQERLTGAVLACSDPDNVGNAFEGLNFGDSVDCAERESFFAKANSKLCVMKNIGWINVDDKEIDYELIKEDIGNGPLEEFYQDLAGDFTNVVDKCQFYSDEVSLENLEEVVMLLVRANFDFVNIDLFVEVQAGRRGLARKGSKEDSKESGSKESGSKESGSKESGSKESGSKSSGSKESGSKSSSSSESSSSESSEETTTPVPTFDEVQETQFLEIVRASMFFGCMESHFVAACGEKLKEDLFARRG